MRKVRGGPWELVSGFRERLHGIRGTQALIALGVLGLCMRCVIAWKTVGSNDMVTWHGFAEHIAQSGLGQEYDTNPRFNHPPLMGLMAGKLLALAAWSGIQFELLFKAPMILADALAGWLVFQSWTRRGHPYASVAFALFCWNPVSMFVSAYHGNTDSLCAALSLLAAMLLDADRSFLAGLALGASINVKLIPVLLVPALLSSTSSFRQALRFLGGLSLGAIPFVPLLLTHYSGFRHHVLGWRSIPGSWGITGLLLEIGASPHLASPTAAASRFWIGRGALIVLGFPALLGAVNRWKGGLWSAREMGACAYVAFLVLSPGWGIQYSVYPVALLFASNLLRGVAYGSVGGLYVVVVYVSLWTGTVPYYSDFYDGLPPGGKLIGYLVWLVCIRTAFELIARRAPPPSLGWQASSPAVREPARPARPAEAVLG